MSGYVIDQGDDVTEIARGIVARADARKWAGDEGDEKALDAACIALATVRALYGDDADLTKRMHRFMVLALVRGLQGIRESAAAQTAQEAEG